MEHTNSITLNVWCITSLRSVFPLPTTVYTACIGYQQQSNYDDVVKAAKDWLKYHDELTLADIKDQCKASRQTISKHLNMAVHNGILLREHQGKKYRLLK